MSIITWLHLSDLHFKESQEDDSYIVLKHLKYDIEEQIKENSLKPDFIVISGDIACKGKAEEYTTACRFLKDLNRITSVPKEKIFMAPGNHDVDRTETPTIIEGLKSQLNTRDSVNRVLTNSTECASVIKRFTNYNNFILKYIEDDHYINTNKLFYTIKLNVNGLCCAILGLNSAWISTEQEEQGRLLLGEKNIRDAIDAAEGSEFKLAILHHPFDWIKDFDRSNAEPLLMDNCDTILIGHMHRPGFSFNATPDSEAIIISAGACYENYNYLNSYNFVKIDTEAKVGTLYLRSYSYERGGFWTKDVRSYRNAKDGIIKFSLPRKTEEIQQVHAHEKLVEILKSSPVRPAKVTTPGEKMEVTVADEDRVEGYSLVSEMQTLENRKDVITSGMPSVCIQGQKYSSIQEAVDAGNPDYPIILDAGTYRENLRIDKSFTIIGAGVEKTIIDGCSRGSVIFVGKNRSEIGVTLRGITVKGGTGTEVKVADNNQNTYVCGGGIINRGTLTITDCIISDNTAYYGGGIFNRGTLNLEKGASVINNAAYNGGGIYNQGGVRSFALVNLNGCLIEKNHAKELGAGIYSRGNRVNICSGTTISGNIAGNSGGGVYLAPSNYILKMYGGDILDNHAVASGGGIYSYDGNVSLKGGNIFSNAARIGAGAFNGGKMTLDGTRIHNNIADKDGDGLGGGIMNNGTLILNSGSIDCNHASRNGGGVCHKKKKDLTGNQALAHHNTLGSDHILDDIALF